MSEQLFKQTIFGQRTLGGAFWPSLSGNPSRTAPLRACVTAWEPSACGFYYETQENVESVQNVRPLSNEIPASIGTAQVLYDRFRMHFSDFQFDEHRDFAIFPNVGRVVTNRYGVFVPQSLFGTGVSLMHELNQMPRGEACVVIRAAARHQTNAHRPKKHRQQPGPEQRWLIEHGSQYLGEWVALEGSRLVAHGMDAREVYQSARNSGVQFPFIVQVEPSGQPPFGGW